MLHVQPRKVALRSIWFVLAFTLCTVCSADAEYCKAVVKVLEVKSNDDKILVRVRVFADRQLKSRAVFYSVWAEYQATLPSFVPGRPGTVMQMNLSHNGMSTVDSGEESVEEELEMRPS